MVIFYKRSLKERDNESYAQAVKYRIEKLGIKAESAGEGIDSVLETPAEKNIDGALEIPAVKNIYSAAEIPAVADNVREMGISRSACNAGAGTVQYKRTESLDMLLTDRKNTFIKDFLINHKYIVIIVTPELLLDLTALFEMDVMHRLFDENKVKIFTIFKDIVPNELPDRVNWIRLTKYTEPKGISDIYTASVDVAAEYWRDRLGDSQNVTVVGYLKNRNFYNDRFLKIISRIYRELENYDVRAKVLVLVIINGYMVIKSRGLKGCKNHQECVCGIAELVYQGRLLTQAELGIINCCILDMLQSNEILG